MTQLKAAMTKKAIMGQVMVQPVRENVWASAAEQQSKVLSAENVGCLCFGAFEVSLWGETRLFV